MMALGDILAARADNARARGTVEAGALGMVTIEALPIRELERLWYGIDRDRVVFYAACRKLQREGAALLRAGKVYHPDEVMALVSDAEAAKAAEAVRALSGWPGTDGRAAQRTDFPTENTDGDSAGAGEAADTGAFFGVPDGTADENAARSGTGTDGEAAFPVGASDSEWRDRMGGQVSREAEIRPAGVQEMTEVRHQVVQENVKESEIRHDTVRENQTAFEEIRHSSVQIENGDGQASREFLAENAEAGGGEAKTQVLPENAADAPLNVGVSDESDVGLPEYGMNFPAESSRLECAKTTDLHENKSEFDVPASTALHEIESESGAKVHEIESEIVPQSGNGLHEIRSESAQSVHENKSDFGGREGGSVHEMKSEQAETVHETTSELAERVARELLDGLKRAAWVR